VINKLFWIQYGYCFDLKSLEVEFSC